MTGRRTLRKPSRAHALLLTTLASPSPLPPYPQMVAERVPDVRDTVKAYDGEEDIAKAFKERMSHLAHQAPKRKGGLLSGAAAAR